MRTLYPPVAPYDTGELSVGDGHMLYYEQSGNPAGIPGVFLHGGPGAGANRAHAQFWDPQRYRIILYDQRGVGRSTPSAATNAGLVANTTWELADDIARLADHLGFDSMGLSGGSWGSTLALAFALRHPQRLRALILRGVITFRQRELDWFFVDGANRLFPDAFAHFLSPLKTEQENAHRGTVLARYHELLFAGPSAQRDRAVRCWRDWGNTLSDLSPARNLAETSGKQPAGQSELVNARLECLYSEAAGFMQRDGHLLESAPSLAHIPLAIVQGRYDLVCPAETAIALHHAWPGSGLQLTHAGHSMFAAETIDALVRAADSAVERRIP